IAASAVVLATWIWSANAGLHGRLLDIPDDEVSVQALGRYEAEQKVVPEYTPQWGKQDPQLGRTDPPPPAGQAAQVVGATTVDARTTRYAVAPGGGSLTLDRFYFPGWQAQTDAGPAVVAPVGELGLLRVELPGSASWVDVSFGDTPVRTAALA